MMILFLKAPPAALQSKSHSQDHTQDHALLSAKLVPTPPHASIPSYGPAAVVTGKRKREIGLVVPAKYVAYTENQKHAQILIKKLP